MPIKGEDFVKMTHEEIRNLFPLDKCDYCKTKVRDPSDLQRTSGGLACQDCYDKKMSDNLDKNPIYVPRVRR